LLAALAWAEVKRLGWPLVCATHSTSRPHRERACYKYPTSCSLPTNPTFPKRHAHISTHLPIPLLITLSQRWGPETGWTSAHNKERRKKAPAVWLSRVVDVSRQQRQQRGEVTPAWAWFTNAGSGTVVVWLNINPDLW